MIIKAIIIEDELPARRTIKSYLKRYFPNVEVVAEASDLVTASEVLEEGRFDFIFLDIQLEDGISIDLIQNKKDLRIVFTTAHEEYASVAFRAKAFGYLLKPIDPMDFKEIVNRVIKDILIVNTQVFKLKVPTKNGYAYIESTTIVHCEADSNYSSIYTSDKKSYLISKSLKHIENELHKTGKFIRVHQSHLVNIAFVDQKNIESNSITLIDGKKIPVSRARKDEFKKIFELI